MERVVTRWLLVVTAVTQVPLGGCADSRAPSGRRSIEQAAEALTWEEVKTLKPAAEPSSAAFGYAASIAGNRAVVGAPFEDVSGRADQGAAYVFARSGSTWTEAPKLVATEGTATDEFGSAVAISGDTVVVGAPMRDVPGSGGPFVQQGAAYVFVRDGSSWTEQQELLGSDSVDNDQFGGAVAISGDTVVVGAFQADVTSALGPEGAAYVFVRSGTTWTQQAKLTTTDTGIHNFGVSVAVSGNTALVGSPNDLGFFTDLGAAYVFTRSGTTWTQAPKLAAPSGEDGDYFGNAVALSGDTALVGSYGAHAAHFFERSSGTWAWKQLVTVVARSVALDGDVAVTGDQSSPFTAPQFGSAKIYLRAAGTWNEEPFTPDLIVSGDNYGRTVAVSGGTVLVGSSGTTPSGVVHVLEASGGAAGAGGASDGGSSGAAATGGSAGNTSAGGSGGAHEGGASGESGAAQGGEAGAGEAGGSSGMPGRGGRTGASGGKPGLGGSPATGGSTATGGSMASGGGTATGGRGNAVGGTSAMSGASGVGGGAGAATGAAGRAGSGGTSGGRKSRGPTDADHSGGCGCRVVPTESSSAYGLWFALLLGRALRKRRGVQR